MCGTGNLYVLGPLDYEKQKSYPLTIVLKDVDNDVNSRLQYEKQCNITINVQVSGTWEKHARPTEEGGGDSGGF